MKKTWLMIYIPLIFSCGEKPISENNTGNVLENLSFSVDTVVVNSGEELIPIQWGIRLSDLTPDKKVLYYLSDTDQTVYEIDLDGLKLLRKIPFEKEGPNGIGEYHAKFQLLPNGNFFFTGFRANSIFSPSGIKVRDIQFTAENIDSLSRDNERNAYFGLLLTRDQNHFLSLPGNFMTGNRELMVANSSDLKGKLTKIPAIDIASEMRIVLRSKEMVSVYAEDIMLQDIGGMGVLSTSATSDIYLYDYSSDSLRLVTYSHALVPNKKVPKARNEVSNMDEFNAEMAKLTEQIGFEKFDWDEKTQRYYRFGKILLPKPDPEAEAKSEVYLLAYDKNFRLIGEKKLEGLTKVPATPFFKNGKLWSYVNVDDELGFAVMDFKFD
jgi:hypothetical protein